ncbi:hypothetical protein M5E88_03690 [Akkermansia muciniphila]|nr:hypothetical protein M5E88_03690 [Akkermansia muciniphila]
MENSNHLTESWSLSWQSVLSSQLWRLEHLYWIENKAGQLQRFSLNRAQRRLHERLWYRNDILKARQLGISTYVAMLMLDMSLFRSNFHCGIIDKSLPDAQQKLAKLHFAWDHLDYVPPNPSAMDVALARLGERIKSLSGVEKKGNGNPVRWRAAAWLSPMGAMCGWGLICEGNHAVSPCFRAGVCFRACSVESQGNPYGGNQYSSPEVLF